MTKSFDEDVQIQPGHSISRASKKKTVGEKKKIGGGIENTQQHRDGPNDDELLSDDVSEGEEYEAPTPPRYSKFLPVRESIVEASDTSRFESSRNILLNPPANITHHDDTRSRISKKRKVKKRGGKKQQSQQS